MKIAFSIWNEKGLSVEEIEVPSQAFVVTIYDGNRELSYDYDTHEIELIENGETVEAFKTQEIYWGKR